jgi:hypothetical protein
MRNDRIGLAKRVHPLAWLWEPLEGDPSFVLGSMFGTKVVYLDGKLALCFASKSEPWRGVLACVEREHHQSLTSQFSSLVPHPILPKWLYLPESADDFERVAEQLVAMAGERDPRIGIMPRQAKRKRSSAAPARSRRGLRP